MEKRTPLYDRHIKLGAQMAPFAGYEMPISYPAGIVAEHMAVRQKAGMFDVCHMGEFLITGAGAASALDRVLTNDMASIAPGRARYSLMCNQAGGVIDDVLVYRLGSEAFMVVVNASNRDKDRAHMEANLGGGCRFEDVSDGTALIAVQGPLAEGIVKKVFDAALPEKYYSFISAPPAAGEKEVFGGVGTLISRTGYTGEDGFEIYAAAGRACEIWDALTEAGGEDMLPCGLGARDTLRLEASMPLYGHELGEGVNARDAGLDFAIKPDKGDFIGRAALAAHIPARKRVGLKITGKGIAREGHKIYINGGEVGVVTSGTHCPYLGYAAAMAYVDAGHAAAGTSVVVDVRGRTVEAVVVDMPFYKRGR